MDEVRGMDCEVFAALMKAGRDYLMQQAVPARTAAVLLAFTATQI